MLNNYSDGMQNGVTCIEVRYDRGKQRQRNRHCGEESLVEELARASPALDVATMEFLRLCIDGEDVGVRFSRHEPRHVLPDVTADGKRWHGELQLGHL